MTVVAVGHVVVRVFACPRRGQRISRNSAPCVPFLPGTVGNAAHMHEKSVGRPAEGVTLSFFGAAARHIINFCCFLRASVAEFLLSGDVTETLEADVQLRGRWRVLGEEKSAARRKQHGRPLISLYLAVGTNKKSYSSPARERNLLLARASRRMLTFILKKSVCQGEP